MLAVFDTTNIKTKANSSVNLNFRWWVHRNCPDYSNPSTDKTSGLQIENVAGVFFILVGGVAIAAVVCLGEYIAKRISKSVKEVNAILNSISAIYLIIYNCLVYLGFNDN